MSNPKPSTCAPINHHQSRGFTLVELMMVVLIMGIIAVSVVPAMGNIRTMNEGAARDDLHRMLEVTKGRAVASGVPHGLEIDLSTSTITIVRINSAGSIEPAPDMLTGGDREINLSSVYPRVSLSNMVNGDGVGGSGRIWFDYVSNPHTRTGSGAFVSLNTEQAVVTLSSGARVVVYPYSGMVEDQ